MAQNKKKSPEPVTPDTFEFEAFDFPREFIARRLFGLKLEPDYARQFRRLHTHSPTFQDIVETMAETIEANKFNNFNQWLDYEQGLDKKFAALMQKRQEAKTSVMKPEVSQKTVKNKKNALAPRAVVKKTPSISSVDSDLEKTVHKADKINSSKSGKRRISKKGAVIGFAQRATANKNEPNTNTAASFYVSSVKKGRKFSKWSSKSSSFKEEDGEIVNEAWIKRAEIAHRKKPKPVSKKTMRSMGTNAST